jgi:hypothetical protein
VFHDTPEVIVREDYNDRDLDVLPVGDPKTATDIQKMAKAQALMGLLGRGINDKEVIRRYLEALEVENVQAILEAPKPKPSFEEQIEMQKTQNDTAKLAIEQQKLGIMWQKTKAEIIKLRAEAVNAIAKAEAAEEGIQMQYYKAELDSFQAAIQAFDMLMGPPIAEGSGNSAGMAGGQRGPVHMGPGPIADREAHLGSGGVLTMDDAVATHGNYAKEVGIIEGLQVAIAKMEAFMEAKE